MDVSIAATQPPDRPVVFVASNVEIVSEGLALQLTRSAEVDLIGRGRLDARSVAEIARNNVRVVVLDLGSAEASDFLCRLRGAGVTARIVAVAIGSTRLDMAEWAELGVAGFVDDSGTVMDVVSSIHRVAGGEFFGSPRTTAALVSSLVERALRRRAPERMRRLTPRETQILHDLERGATNKEIARRLGISAATVKNHVHHLLEKLELRKRQDAGALVRSGRL